MNTQQLKLLFKQWGKATLTYLAAAGKWLLLAGVVGVVAGAVSSAFAHVLIGANGLRGAYPLIALGLPAGGLLIVLLYRAFRNGDDHGTNTVIDGLNGRGEIPFCMAPLIFIGTAITHLFGGSAGREGAALQLGGSIANGMGKAVRLNENDRRIMIMCGMSAGFSALFGTPLAAAVFAMEMARVGTLQYAALLPCAVASLVARFVAQALQVPPEIFPILRVPAMQLGGFFGMVLFAVLVALASILFCQLMHQSGRLCRRYFKNPYLRVAVGGCLVLGLSALLGTDTYMGSGIGMIESIFHHGGSAMPYDFLLKMLFTAITLGAGFKGGEIVPTLAIGAALGCMLAGVFGLPVELAAACGMVGMFCGATNAPLTSLLIAFELFGFGGMPYYLTVVPVCFLLSGKSSLYHSQKILFSKVDMEVMDPPEN